VSGVDPSLGELDVGAVPTHVPIYQSHALSSRARNGRIRGPLSCFVIDVTFFCLIPAH
jgi:hypothetical protein